MILLILIVLTLLALALAITVPMTITFSCSGSTTIQDTVTVTGVAIVDAAVTLTASEVNHLVPFSYLTANLKGIYVKAAQDITIKVDSTGAPEQTVTVKAGVPFCWVFGQPSGSNPFITDCNVGWYLTNGAAVTCDVYIRILN